VGNGYLDIVHLLIKLNPSINLATKDGMTAHRLASKKGYLNIVLGIELNNLPNDNSWTALHFAMTKGHLEIVQLLIELNPSIEARSQIAGVGMRRLKEH
jgi:ankyrin repeat protein